MIRIILAARNQFVSIIAVGTLLAVSAAAADDKPAQSKQPALEKAFQENLSGATLVGHFTGSGSDPRDDISEERYSISKVVKLPDQVDKWRFFVRIQYGKIDINVPLDLEVKWADDTPVISLTKYAIPGLGTFSARVLIYDGQYAGTWSHGKSGGHLFGKVEKPPAAAKRKSSEGERPTSDLQQDTATPSKSGLTLPSEAPQC